MHRARSRSTRSSARSHHAGSSRTASPPSPRTRSSRSTESTTSSAGWLAALASWLRCPRCEESLDAVEDLVLGCANGHRFDCNKRGYLHAADAASGISGDPRPLLEARSRFLALGHYDPIAVALAGLVEPQGTSSVLDAGCGSGFYLSRLLAAHPQLDSLALDVSPAAVAMTVAATGAPGVVADIWQPLPIRDHRADVILSVFAPRNPGESARVLRPGGRFIVVTPSESHLRELRAAGLLLGIQADKSARLEQSLTPLFSLSSRTLLEFELQLDPPTARLLTDMGPSGHHARPEARDWPGGSVTASVELSVWTAPTAPV